MTRLAWWQKGLVGWSVGLLVFLYLPILVLILFSFNASRISSFPLSGFTLDWYVRLSENQELLRALGNSLKVAVGATVLAVLVGVPAAIALDRYKFPGKAFFQTVVLLPLALPGIVTGVAMLVVYKEIGLPQSLWTVGIGHATALLGVVISQVMARLAKLNKRLFEASADLGASPLETFYRITLPNLRSAIAGSALLSFTLSFDEIPVTYFLTGREITLPIYIYSTLRRGITPEINAIGALIVVVSIALITVSVLLMREPVRGPKRAAPSKPKPLSKEDPMNFIPKSLTQVTKAALINGQWVDGSAGVFEVKSPHSRAVIHNVGRCAASDVEKAVAAAKAAQPAWRALPYIQRAKIMRNIHRLFVERAEAIAQMITAEIGKTITDAREEVLEYAAPSWGKAAEEILRHRGLSFPSTQENTTNKRLVMNHRPLGVVAAITPYNFPTDISSIALAHIAAAGNTIIWKPSEYSPVCCAMVADLFKDAGLPDGVINVVQGFGDVGAALVDHKDVDGVFFTGSTKTGKEIAAKCALRPHLLELGGDGPFIILPDADIDRAVDGAINGCFYYSGQVCTSAERLLVHEAVYDEFVEKFRAAARKLRIGDPSLEQTQMGPLCNEGTLKRVKEHVEDAERRGAKIEKIGPEEGLYYPATILTDVTVDMLIAQEESFGPVAPIIKIKSAEEAIKIAHQTGLGLIASLWTRDLATAWRVGEALPHGTVNINETSNYWDQLAPFGGTGQSGVGRELSQWFLETFTEKKLLVFDLGGEVRYDRRAEGGW